jgi:hypothetical protein
LRYDIWIGEQPATGTVKAFETMEEGLIAANRLTGLDFVGSDNKNDPSPVSSLEFGVGEERCLNFRLFGSTSGVTDAESLPIRIAIFWSDEMQYVADYQIPYDSALDRLIGIQVKAPAQPGNYQLMIVAFTHLGHSQFNREGIYTGYSWAAFTRRALVDVRP